MFETRRRSIGELFERHRDELLGFLNNRVGSADAPDLLQEAFARVIRRDDEKPIAAPLYFLLKVAANLARDHSRRRAFESKWLNFGADCADGLSPEETPLERLERKERARLFRDAVAGLPPRCREVFVLCFHEKKPLPEIARELGISDSMARRHLRLALKRCREAIE
ncbi:MAG: RNA polymerase subunit sigma-24 [Methylocystaceae bacterium]|nr:MAG: RNA polymerase subunit sigma-24 [Methylocystaceae bacterium]